MCEQCRRGDFAMCVNRKVTGIDFDGGYAEYMIAPVTALAAIPDDVPAEEAGPFMCAGVTVYNALRHAGARAGEVVAVHGIGGLVHLHRSVCAFSWERHAPAWLLEPGLSLAFPGTKALAQEVLRKHTSACIEQHLGRAFAYWHAQHAGLLSAVAAARIQAAVSLRC